MRDIAANPDAGLKTVFNRGAIVDAPVETAQSRFLRRSGKTGEAALHTRQEIRAGGERDVIRAVKVGQDARGGAAEGAVA